MIVLDPAEQRRSENREARAYAVTHGGMLNMLFDATDNHALDGQVFRFDTPFAYRGDLLLLRSGCYGDKVNHRIDFRIDHDDHFQVASTDDALELMLDDERLQFRLHLGKFKDGPLIARLCSSNSRSAMSHGSDILSEHRETIHGHSVRVVTKARLKELTLCKEGAAGDNAYAVLVDTAVTPKPQAGSVSPIMKAAQTVHRISQAVKRLKANALATYGDHKSSGPRAMSVDQLNRLESEEKRRLQEHSLRYNRMR